MDMGDILKHFILSLHPWSFFFMTIKEIIDVSNGYTEIYDWLGNFLGISYYLLLFKLIKKTSISHPISY